MRETSTQKHYISHHLGVNEGYFNQTGLANSWSHPKTHSSTPNIPTQILHTASPNLMLPAQRQEKKPGLCPLVGRWRKLFLVCAHSMFVYRLFYSENPGFQHQHIYSFAQFKNSSKIFSELIHPYHNKPKKKKKITICLQYFYSLSLPCQ